MPSATIDAGTIAVWKAHIKNLLELINEYKHFTDSYIIEFFVEKHWNSVPPHWRLTLEKMQPSDVSRELFHGKPLGGYKRVLPLSLLAFKSCCHNLALPRIQDNACDDDEFCKLNPSQSKLVEHIFRKHVKPKKQHEIRKLSDIVVKAASQSKVSRIIDVGSGQGHLSRLLAIGHDLNVSSLESDEKNVERAKKFDDECVKTSFKNNPDCRKVPPSHTVHFLASFIPESDFLTLIPSLDTEDTMLLTGLHACGDLSATMVDTFANCDKVRSLVSIACCYMKLTACGAEVKSSKVSNKEEKKLGYPMSCFVKSLTNHQLTYKTREISCHANESFADRLLSDGDHLKIHCYRAVLESIIREHYPSLIRPGVQTGKNAHMKSFFEYAISAFAKLELVSISESQICCDKVENMLSEWKKVVIFYALCLLLAPVIESVLLLDRAVFLYEKGIRSKIECIFDPKLSPRCFALVALKDDGTTIT